MDLFNEDQKVYANILALNWKQPYASLMLHGKIETRTWETKYRGLVLICASKAPYSFEVIRSNYNDFQYQQKNIPPIIPESFIEFLKEKGYSLIKTKEK